MLTTENVFGKETINCMDQQIIKVAILDLYNNEPNEGMRGIQNLLNTHELPENLKFEYTRFDVRFKLEVPDIDFDIYISSGGPGSPLADADNVWEKPYFNLIDRLIDFNKNSAGQKKFVFFICHSFQLMCRHLELAEVTKRKSTAFGIFPMHKFEFGFQEPCFKQINDPFFAVDSRDWQVIKPDHKVLKKFGARVLAIEKERPHVPYERAIMGIRFNDEMIGTQFHPEADPIGMLHYLLRPDKKEHIIKHHGEDKYEEMLLHLNDPDKISLTQKSIIPAFLDQAIQHSLVYA